MTQSDRRADWGEAALRTDPDHGEHGRDQAAVRTTATDVIANVMHACDRYEIDPYEVLAAARNYYEGDVDEAGGATADPRPAEMLFAAEDAERSDR